MATLDFTWSNCKRQSRTWCTSDVLHILEPPLLACIPPEIREIDSCNCFAFDLGWEGPAPTVTENASARPITPISNCHPGEFIDYKTSMIIDKKPCCSTRISVSLTHYTCLKKGHGGANTQVNAVNPLETIIASRVSVTPILTSNLIQLVRNLGENRAT